MSNKIQGLLKDVQRTVVKHSPEILTGLGIAGMFTTTVLAVKATPKALVLLEEAKAELETEKVPILEAVKTTWKCYLPAAVTGVASVTCLIGANSVHLRRSAALAAAYNISTTALTEYKDKVVETIGEKKEQAIQDKISEDHIKAHPASKSDIIETKKGTTKCFDRYTGRYFYSDIDAIKKAENELNRNIISEGYQSLNDFYDLLNLDHSDIGDIVGWRIDDRTINIYRSAQLDDEDTPCIVISFNTQPHYNYDSYR